MTPDDLRQARPLRDDFVRRFAPLLGDDSRPARAHAYLRGLLLDNDDNQTAEASALTVHGDPAQVRMTQVFLAQSPWSDAPLRAELADGVAAELGAPDGTLSVADGSFPKCGTKSVGVARQYGGETGKLDNCQVAVYLAYAAAGGIPCSIPGCTYPRPGRRTDPQTVAAIAAALPVSAWKRLAFREGRQGTQHRHFARVRFYPEREDLPGPEWWLLNERSCDQQPYVKYYLSNAAVACPLLALAPAGHRRYPIEECFLRGKDELGWGDDEVQGWRGWHHQQTLVMLALWFLLLQQRRWGKKSVAGMTLPDTRRRLQSVLCRAAPVDPGAYAIGISNGRQLRNRTARECHARTRARAWRK